MPLRAATAHMLALSSAPPSVPDDPSCPGSARALKGRHLTRCDLQCLVNVESNMCHHGSRITRYTYKYIVVPWARGARRALLVVNVYIMLVYTVEKLLQFRHVRLRERRGTRRERKFCPVNVH